MLLITLPQVADAQLPELKLDHFQVYKIAAAKNVTSSAILKGQFDREGISAEIEGPVYFANPVSKDRSELLDANAHLTWYNIRQKEKGPRRAVVFRNQFGGALDQQLTIGQPGYLLAPAAKTHRQEYPLSRRLDQFKCYEVLEHAVEPKRIVLRDPFGSRRVAVMKPVFFAVPV